MNLTAFAAVAIFACLPRTATAHPSLVGSSKCGEDAHPTTARSHHAAPVPDNTMSFLMYYAAEAPTDDEMVPDRTIPGDWAIDSAQYMGRCACATIHGVFARRVFRKSRASQSYIRSAYAASKY